MCSQTPIWTFTSEKKLLANTPHTMSEALSSKARSLTGKESRSSGTSLSTPTFVANLKNINLSLLSRPWTRLKTESKLPRLCLRHSTLRPFSLECRQLWHYTRKSLAQKEKTERLTTFTSKIWLEQLLTQEMVWLTCSLSAMEQSFLAVSRAFHWLAAT